MNEEYQFIDTAGWTYTVDDIDRILQTALDNKEIPVNTSFEKWLKKEGFKVHKVGKKGKKALEHITREAFDNIPREKDSTKAPLFKDISQDEFNNFVNEDTAVKILNRKYGDKYEFKVPTMPGVDFITGTSNYTGETHKIPLNTQYNQENFWDNSLLNATNLDESYTDLIDWMEGINSNNPEVKAQHDLNKLNITQPITLIPAQEEVQNLETGLSGATLDYKPLTLTYADTQIITNEANAIFQNILQYPQNYKDPKTDTSLPLDNTGKMMKRQDYEAYNEELARILKSEISKMFFSGDSSAIQMYIGNQEEADALAAKFKGYEMSSEDLTTMFGVGSPLFKLGLANVETNTEKSNWNTVLGNTDTEIENMVSTSKKNWEEFEYNKLDQGEKNRADLIKERDKLSNYIRVEEANTETLIEEYKEKDKDEDYNKKIKAIEDRIAKYKADLAINNAKLAKLPETLLDEKGIYKGIDNVRTEAALAGIKEENGATSISTRENIDNITENYIEQRLLFQKDALNDYITLDLSKNFTEGGEPKAAGFMLRQYRDRIIKYLNDNNISITDPKNIKVSVYQAYDMGLFEVGDINIWDDPSEDVKGTAREATEVGEFSFKNWSDWGNYTNIFDAEDIEKLKSYKLTMEQNQDKLEVLYNLRYLQERPKDETENFFTGIRDEFIRATGSLFGYDDDVLKDWNTGRLEGRDLLDKTNITLGHINAIADEEGIYSIVLDAEDRAAFQRSGLESLGGAIGGFAPVVADLMITGLLLESGAGTAMGIARGSKLTRNLVKSIDKIYDNLKYGGGAFNTLSYMTLRGFGEEIKLQAAQTEFEDMAGFAFGAFGAALRGFKTPALMQGIPKAITRVIGQSISGMTASEIALNTEAIYKDIIDVEDFANSWKENYGSLSAVTQRMIQNALLFGIYGSGAKDIYKRYAGTKAEQAIAKSDFTWGRGKQVQVLYDAMAELQREIDALVGDSPQTQKAWGELLKDPTLTDAQIAKAGKIKSLMDAKAAINVYKFQTTMGRTLAMVEPYLRDDKGELTKKINPKFDAEAKQMYDTYMNDLKTILGKEFTVGELIISDKKLVDELGVETNALFDLNTGNITLSRSKMQGRDAGGILVHELFHKSVAKALDTSPVLLKKFEGQLDGLVDKYFPGLSAGVRETYKKNFPDLTPEAKELKIQEEILAKFLQDISSPAEYHRLMDRGFWGEVKDVIGDIIEGVPRLSKNKYTDINKLTPDQLLKTLARLSYQIQTGEGTGVKSRLFKVVNEVDAKANQLVTEMPSKDIKESTLEIVRENKRIEDDIREQGLKDDKGIYADEIMQDRLLNNNLAIISELAGTASSPGRLRDKNIPEAEQLKDYNAWFNELYIQAQALTKAFRIGEKTAPFGAYLRENLRYRYGNALESLQKGKVGEGPRLSDTTLEKTLKTGEAALETVGTLELAKEFNIDKKLLQEFRNNLYQDIVSAERLTDLSYKNFRATIPKGFYNKVFGKTRAEREATIRKLGKSIIESWPETNQDPTGKSLNVGKGLLDLAYGIDIGRAQMSKGATGAGLLIRGKQFITPKELIDWAFGKDVNYTTSQARIKSIMELTTRGLATQLLSEAKAVEKMAVEFSKESELVKAAETRLKEVWDTELKRASEADVPFRISDINKAMEGVDRAIEDFGKEVFGTIREGLSGSMASKDIGIIDARKMELIMKMRPNIVGIKAIIGDQYKNLSETTKTLLEDLAKVYNRNQAAADRIAVKIFAHELDMSETVYRKYMLSAEKDYKALSKVLNTKYMSTRDIANDPTHKKFVKAFLKNLPDIKQLPENIQNIVLNTIGWSFDTKRGGMTINGAKMTLKGLGLERGTPGYDILVKMFGKDFGSTKNPTRNWMDAFARTDWGKSFNTQVKKVLEIKNVTRRTKELQNLLKQENVTYKNTIKANLGILKDSYKAMMKTGLEMKNPQAALQSMQNFLKIQTNFARGLFKTMVPLKFLDLDPKTGRTLYTEKFENWHTEHMRELLNVNGRFLKDAKLLLDGNISKSEFNKRLNAGIKQLQQGLISARTAELKDKDGKTKMHFYDPILNIVFGGKKVWDTTIGLDTTYGRTETLADVIMNTATRRVFDLIREAPKDQLSTAGIIAKQRIENPKEWNSALKNNQQWNYVGDMMYSKDLTNGEYLNSLKNRDKALALAREKNRKAKGISVFDFDDTLAKTKSKVIVYAPSFVPGTSREVSMKLTPAEFAKRHAELERMGASFDFSEFNKVLGGKKGPLFDLAVKRQGKFGTGDIYILTARPQTAAPAIRAFLKGLGLDIPLKNIVGLESGSPIAKSDWILNKAAEGYNDFYFADDAVKNVKAVRDVLDVIDVKSKVQQVMAAKDISNEFNKVLEQSFGIERFKGYSQTKARTIGAKHKESWWLPASASDLPLMMDRIAGKGKQGNAHQKLFNKALYQPYARAEKNLTEATLSVYRDFKALQAQFGARAKLKDKIGDYTVEQAIRVRNWTTLGIEIPGLSKRDSKLLNDKVNKDPELSAFADQIISMQKGQYADPAKYWEAGGLFMDINNTLKINTRREFLKEWKDNVDTIFTPEFYNKLESVQGPKYVESLKNMLGRMWRGSNRTGKESRLETKMLNFLNNATASIMFLNTRTAVLQTISSFNYINWTDNNPLKAAARFANLPQYVKDWNRLMNSDWAIARRKGLRINIQEAELVETLQGAQDKGSAMLGWLLREGFILTKMGDTFATATGGATFYRNRINTYKKQGLSEKAAEQKAYQDWIELSEENQQSARMDRISMQQATPLGRVVLAFANTPMQYARLQKRAYMDLVNKRGDAKTNISKIVYYAFVQNLMFNALQNAIFTEIYNEPGVSDDKTIRIANGMVDGILRGGGITGSGVAMLKNVALKLYTEDKKKRPKYSNAAWELLGISPPLKSKVGKVRSGLAAAEYNMKDIKSMGFSLDNPAYLAAGQLVSGFTNVPLDRLVIKMQNIQEAMNEELQWYERMALLGGWKDWELGIKEGETAKYFGDEFNLEKRQKEIIKQTNSDWLFKTGNP